MGYLIDSGHKFTTGFTFSILYVIEMEFHIVCAFDFYIAVAIAIKIHRRQLCV